MIKFLQVPLVAIPLFIFLVMGAVIFMDWLFDRSLWLGIGVGVVVVISLVALNLYIQV